ncbi:BgiBFREP16.3, partial [Biomphalaria glabrata]
MAFFLRLALWASVVFWSASELVIDVQPNAISPEITPQLVINCSITNNEVQDIDVIKSLTLSRYNETIKEFEDLFVLNSSTLDLKQLHRFIFSQVSFGNLFITLALHNPIQIDAKVYRCNATGDNSKGTNISKFAKKAVEWEKNSTAFIEEIRRLKKNEDNCQCSVKKNKRTDIDQRSKVQFYRSSEIVQELTEPLILNCSFKHLNYDQKEDYTLQSLFLLHESNGVIAYINKGQTVVTAIKEITSQNVTGEIYANKSIDSYLQVEWKNIKISDSGKYVCEAHVQYAEGKSEKINEMLTITVQRPTLDDLVNVIQKLIAQADEDKEDIQASKQKIEKIEADLNTNNQKIQRIRQEVDTNNQNITSIKEDINTNTQNVKSIKVNIDRNITMLREDILTNIHGINEDLGTCKRDIGNIRIDMDIYASMLKEQLDINTRNIKNLEVVMDTNNTQTKKDININIQTIKQIRVDLDTHITSLKKTLDTNTLDIQNIKVDSDTNITRLQKDIDTNAGNIKIIKADMDANITNLKDNLETNKQMINNVKENLRAMLSNYSSDLEELKQILEVNSNIRPKSCRNVTYTEARVIVTLASGLKVMCDTKTEGGGWIIIQRRINGKVDFYRGWKEYRDGFGDYNIGEFYLGNENIFKLTSTGQYDLRIDLENNNKTYFAQYENFKVLSETEKYKLQIGKYSGNAGDSLSNHNSMFFSTFDRDNDIYSLNCAVERSGAWWYYYCSASNLNGKWENDTHARRLH